MGRLRTSKEFLLITVSEGCRSIMEAIMETTGKHGSRGRKLSDHIFKHKHETECEREVCGKTFYSHTPPLGIDSTSRSHNSFLVGTSYCGPSFQIPGLGETFLIQTISHPKPKHMHLPLKDSSGGLSHNVPHDHKNNLSGVKI